MFHVEGAISMPLSSLEAELDKGGELGAEGEAGKLVLVMCRRGVASGKAVQILRGRGWSNAWSVKGGMREWANSVGGVPWY
jgi:rhodanese-related sulfurtransferase